MEFLQVYGFNIKVGEARDFQEWLGANEDAWKAAMPDGTAYVGTYAAVYSSEKEAGSFFTVYRLDSYAAQDRLAEALNGGELARIMGESIEFVDFDNNAGWSQLLLKSVTDATVWN